MLLDDLLISRKLVFIFFHYSLYLSLDLEFREALQVSSCSLGGSSPVHVVCRIRLVLGCRRGANCHEVPMNFPVGTKLLVDNVILIQFS